MDEVEVAVIGAGPIGLEMGVALKRAGKSFVIIEAGPIGATMAWWAPGTRYFSSPERIAIAGVPLLIDGEEKATREDYLRYLRQVTAQFDLPVRTFERVIAIERDTDGFVVRTTRSGHGVGGEPEQRRAAAPPDEAPDRAYLADKVVLAIGNMHLPRPVGVPGEDLPHVSHYLGEIHQYFRKHVVIVGGRNSAVEAAIRLHRAGARVTLCQRKAELERDRIKYWILPELEWLIKKGFIAFEPSINVREITPDTVVLARNDQPIHVDADAVLLLTGYVQESELFESIGIELHSEERKPRFSLDTMETNIPNVYVAGTATGGSQRRAKVFIENAHEHVEKIIRAIAGRGVDVRDQAVFEGNEES